MRRAHNASFNDVYLRRRSSQIDDQDRRDAVGNRGANCAEYFYLIKINLECGSRRHRLIILEDIVVNRDEKDFVSLGLRRLLGLKMVKGAILPLFARYNEPIERHFGDGYRDIFARLNRYHALQLFGLDVR